MKRKLIVYLPVFVFVVILFSNCGGETIIIDENQIIGRWKSGTLYEVYEAGGSGYTWDEADDVTEDERQQFEWSITDNNILTQIHLMEMGGRIPKVYSITQLNSNSLVYEDDYGVKHVFVRVE